MDITIAPVTPENREVVSALRVRPGQEGFIETVAECLAEADELPHWRPVGIYHGSALIGFAMYGLWLYEGERGRVWLDRFLLDGGAQGRGYALPALRALIARIRAEYGYDALFLSIYEENTHALSLYRGLGFALNGEVDINGEKVMVLRGAPPAES